MKQIHFLNNNKNNLDSIQTITNKTMKKKYKIHREKISKELSHKRIAMISEPIEINNNIKFKESDFSADFKQKNKNIFNLNLNDLINLNYNNLELKFYFFSLRKISMKGESINLILENVSNEKISFFFKILFDENVNDLTIEEFLKFKYEILIILINLNVDCEDFNEIFIKNSQNIFNFINKIINNINIENNPYLIILYHLIWLFGNIINDDEIFEIITKNENIKIPFLIKNIFDLKIFKILKPTFELFFTFLTRIENQNFIIENKFFIEYFSKIIQFSLNEFQINLLSIVFQTLNLFLEKKQIVDFILTNFDKFKNLIEIIFNCFKIYTKSQCCLINILKHDENFFVFNQYENLIFHNFVLNCISNNENNNDLKLIKHAIKILTILIDSEKILNILINKENEFKLFGNLNRIFIQFNNFSLIFTIFSFYDKIFEKGNLFLKKTLIDKNLHIFCIEELQKIIDIDSKNKNKYIDKITFIILSILKKTLLFSNEIEITSNPIKDDLEQRGFFDFLLKLQQNKNSFIYDLAIDILENFYEGDFNY